MKLLVNGSSISRGPRSWPYHLTEMLNCDLVNLSCSGAGVDYTRDAVIAELSQRDYDFVIVQWPSFVWRDHKVSDPENYSIIYTSNYQSKQNDWPEKVIFPINDQDYVEKDWIFGCGYKNKDRSDPKFTQFWASYYNSISNWQLLKEMLISIIFLQSYLKQRQIPYLFISNRPVKKLKEHQALWDQIDTDCIYQETYVADIAQEKNSLDIDGIHPGTEAHKQFAELLLPKILRLYEK
jgi:hypothetical protein